MKTAYKTLVIHPGDPTTDFLAPVYQNKDWSLIRAARPSKRRVKDAIKNHDRIIMMGHGYTGGLYYPDGNDYMIDSDMVYLLRQKQLAGIWCYANTFFHKYQLAGFRTGMIISELNELDYCGVTATDQNIQQANTLLACALSNVDLFDSLAAASVHGYFLDPKYNDNPVVNYNKSTVKG